MAADPTLIPENLIAFSFSSVFWIDASSSGTITQGLEGICKLPAAQSSGLDGSYESALYWIGSLRGTVADPGRALWGMLEYSTAELVDELMDRRGREWSIWQFCVA